MRGFFTSVAVCLAVQGCGALVPAETDTPACHEEAAQVLFVVDHSTSALVTDPNGLRARVVDLAVARLSGRPLVSFAVVQFGRGVETLTQHCQSYLPQPVNCVPGFTSVPNDAHQAGLAAGTGGSGPSDLAGALQEALRLIEDANGRQALEDRQRTHVRVVVLTDGDADAELARSIAGMRQRLDLASVRLHAVLAVNPDRATPLREQQEAAMRQLALSGGGEFIPASADTPYTLRDILVSELGAGARCPL